ncbi:glycosyltransferase family 39 protein [Geodermatophilus sp. DSM 44513]|uniref:glycosyltransferase family 39 protein n=1 Tax=Geodermatophilus sp. DSM 44513 TaxID=1528104 RepID=UPI00141299CF|nr:glycosyltransferase family 39 protein [Geodermatophilus sp. DSM 44513]WNV75880.1 glycosyltransferase family 39 protein [Geodermatophilus sp. DSM 44513]
MVAFVHLLCLGLVVLGARVEYLRNSIRLDEAQSLWQTNRTYEDMLRVIAQDVHVPLYHVLLRTWRLVLGPDVETARLLSLLFLLASVPVFYLVARKVLSRPWALFALVVFSCSPFLQWYGGEARMYSLLVLVTLVSQLAFLGVVQTGRWTAWVGYAAAAVVGVYVHYFFVFVLVTQGLFVLFLWRRLPRTAVPAMAGVAALVGAAYVPWFLFFRANGSASETRPSLPEPSSIDLANVYSQFLFGFQSDAINAILLSSWPLLVLAALASVRVGVRLEKATAYLLAAAFVPVLLAFAVSHLVTPFFLSRYMVAALPALLLVVLRFLSGLTRPVARALAATLLVVTVLGTVVQAANPDTPVDEDYRAAARLVEDDATPQDVVVLSSPFTVYPFEYYYDGAARVSTLPVWDRQEATPAFDAAALPGQVDSLIAGHQYLHLVLSYDQGYEEQVFQHFEGRFERISSQELSPGLRLLVYRVGYSELPPAGQLDGVPD